MDQSTIVKPRTTYHSVLGFVIASLRGDKKIKQGVFAKKINMSSPSLSKMEKGTNTITYDTLLQIAKVCECPVSTIIHSTEELVESLENKGILVFLNEKEMQLQIEAEENSKDSSMIMPMSGKMLKSLILNTTAKAKAKQKK